MIVHSLRIVLSGGTHDYLVLIRCPEEPLEDAAENVKVAWKVEYTIHSMCCLMLGRMSPALQRQFELYFPQAMLDELRRMFEKPKAVEIYDLVDTLHSCKQAPGKSVSAHVLEMKGYMDQLQALGKPYDNDMAINLINRSLNKDFGDFVRNFNMHCVGKTVLAIQKGRVNKPKPQANKKGKSKGKADKNKQVVAYQPKPKQNPPQKKENPKKDQACHYCNVVGHWKRNCPLYLEELRINKNKKAEHGAATSDLPIEWQTRMQKLQREGLLESINDESYEKCESCISGKMTKKPFNNNIERATDLLVVMVYVYLLKHKHEVFETFKVFKSEVELQLGKKIKALRSDRGGEYLSQEFKEYLESAVRILNMVPTKKVDKTPYEIWHGKAPNLSYLKVWGYEAYVKRDSADKLQQRSVKFLERDLISQEFSGRDYDLEDDHMDTLPSENTSEIPVEPESLGPPPELIPVRRSERTTRAPNRLCLNMEVEDDVVGDLGEPANYKAAMLDPDKVIWQGAMDEEMNSMKVNEVWTEVDPPPNAKIVRSKWLFKKKTDMDGQVHTYKARLVAKGHTQTYGIDYEETFSPVADIRAISIS
ncbi:retrotransposon protein, putative, ty1-copia subclass [Tanacetum coccineum]